MAIELTSKIIEAAPGVRRAFHVFTPALQHRLAVGAESNLPVMALRSSIHGFTKMKLFHRIEAMGPSSLDPLFDNPLPGTGGRGVAIMFTEFPLRVWYPTGLRTPMIETEGRDPKAILQDVIDLYEVSLEFTA